MVRVASAVVAGVVLGVFCLVWDHDLEGGDCVTPKPQFLTRRLVGLVELDWSLGLMIRNNLDTPCETIMCKLL